MPGSEESRNLGCLLALIAAGVIGLAALVLLLPDGGDSGDDPPQAVPPTPTGAASQLPSDPAGATLELADEAGGLQRLGFPAGPEQAERQDRLAELELPVREMLSDHYEDEDALLSVTFYGGELAAPLSDAQVRETAHDRLEAVFASNFPNLTDGSALQSYDPGPLGGEVWCRTYGVGSFDTSEAYACGWLDRWTVGYLFAPSGSAGLDSEQAVAALLVAMRADLESAPVNP